jgi:hypothetical protein
MYLSEKDLVHDFLQFLASRDKPWPITALTMEFDYRSGRADVIATDAEGRVLAFEAKLKRWRQALAQAYRNRCFAHRSWVVLPADTAYRALRFKAEFRRRGVGICLVSNAGLIELLESSDEDPCLQWLCHKALAKVEESARI